MFDEQVSGSRGAGERLGVAKSLNESWTRIAIYVSLFVLYVVGGAEVKSVRIAESFPRKKFLGYVSMPLYSFGILIKTCLQPLFLLCPCRTGWASVGSVEVLAARDHLQSA